MGPDVTKIHLGVTDIPYATKGHSITTGAVAQILEDRYGLFSAFVAMHEKVIQHDIENALRGSLENMIVRGAPSKVPLATALSDIEELFRDAISMQSYDFKLPGVPTQAALRGVNRRMKRPYVRRGPRPSFRDTGTLMNSFRAWVD